MDSSEWKQLLEGDKDLGPAVYQDKKILSQAANYHVNVDGLEKNQLQNDIYKTVSVNDFNPENSKILKKERHLWQEMDVGLADIIRLVLENSERPVVVISDDKIIYLNKTLMLMLGLKDVRQALGNPFLSFVNKNQWNSLAENIGEMLTNAKKVRIDLKAENGKIVHSDFQAIYLPDTSHFSFILIGSHVQTQNHSVDVLKNLYDDLTGLPNFFLFEDRVQVAVNNESYKKYSTGKNIIAIVGIAIQNFEERDDKIWKEQVLAEIATDLVLSQQKIVTVARGIKYQFWMLFPILRNEKEFSVEFDKVKDVLKKAVKNHNLVFSVGVNFYPEPAGSAKKLIEQAVVALEKAKLHKENYIEYCREDIEKGSF